jgi:NitT/TauT family transport system substrate-binding protein
MVALGVAILIPALGENAQALDKVQVVETGIGSSTRWPAYLAAANGTFRAHEIDVEFLPAPASSGVMQQVASGSVAIGAGSPVDALRAIDKGAPITMLRLESSEAPYEIFAKASIKTAAELSGKTIMIGGIKDITRFYFEQLMAKSGVNTKTFDFVFAGATAQRFAALASGSIDATILASPFNFRARAAGYTNLGATPDFVRNVPFSAFVVNVTWAQHNRAVIDRFLSAYEEGVKQFYDVENREKAIDVLQKLSKADRNDVAQTYDFFIKIGSVDRSGIIPQQGMSDLLQLLRNQGDIEGPVDLTRFYDERLGSKVR